ncbi:MAG TPA: hypothetical protein VF468_27380 [Actinomycetota bacterium]|nr:hypothetical protein [Actinomycetota bacterium]
MGVSAPERPRPGTAASATLSSRAGASRPRTRSRGSGATPLGRFTTIDVPGAAATQLTRINDRGQIVGLDINPKGAPSQQPTGTAPRGRIA